MRDTGVIHTMRSAFAGAGHAPVDPVSFAAARLRAVKRAVRDDLRAHGFVRRDLLELLAVELGDPAQPVDAPVVAIVNGGRWIAPCECGGAEYVDAETRLFMCCSCFNTAHGHRWRLVELPDPTTAALVEKALLARPKAQTRNWRPAETVAQLLAENIVNGVSKPEVER